MSDATKYATLISFSENAKAFEAMAKISGTGAVVSGAVVERSEDGKLTVADAADAQFGSGIASGSLIGMLVGVLGGPLGMLFGWSVGSLGGAVADSSRADDQSAAVEALSALIPAGATAIVAETQEASTDVLDAFVNEMGGTIVRRPYDEVVAEVEAAEQATADAAAAARKALKEQKRAEHKAEKEARHAG